MKRRFHTRTYSVPGADAEQVAACARWSSTCAAPMPRPRSRADRSEPLLRPPALRLRRPAPRSGEIEPIEVHHLRPCGDEVADEFFVRVQASVDFRQRAELRVRAEDEIDARAGPFHLTGLAVAPFEDVLCVGHGLPLRAHVEEGREEVVG